MLGELLQAATSDDAIIARAKATVSNRRSEPTMDEISELCADAALPVRPEVGRLLYMLVRVTRPSNVVEFGTSFGASLLYLAAGVHDNGFGKVLGTEMSSKKIAKAQHNLQRVGLAEHALIVQGDARETLANIPPPVDLVLLDGWKDLYLPVLQVLEPKLRPGTVVLADNLSMLPAAYLEHVRAPGSHYVSISLPLGDGVELSLRVA
ncbi:MAG: class I SAM-dependent methyltransferase [Polyangiaceae bacterium]